MTAKDPAQSKEMVTEMVARIKTLEDLTNRPTPPATIKMCLMGFIDDMTRMHTRSFQGIDNTAEDEGVGQFKKEIIKFANTMNGSQKHNKSSNMQIGAFQQRDAESNSEISKNCD